MPVGAEAAKSCLRTELEWMQSVDARARTTKQTGTSGAFGGAAEWKGSGTGCERVEMDSVADTYGKEDN